MTDELKPCPFCGSPARLNRSTGESLWSHDQVEWTQVQCTNEDCGVATENRCEGWEPTPIESWNSRALTAAPPAQAGDGYLDRLIDALLMPPAAHTESDLRKLQRQAAEMLQLMRIASLPTQPAAQATPEPEWETTPKDGEQWETSPKEATPEPTTPEPTTPQPLGYIPTDAIGQIKTPPRLITHKVPVLSYAAEGYTAIYTHPAPGVPEVWTDEQCLEFMCVALRHVEYKRGTKGPTCDDVRLGVARALAAAQAKGGGHV